MPSLRLEPVQPGVFPVRPPLPRMFLHQPKVKGHRRDPHQGPDLRPRPLLPDRGHHEVHGLQGEQAGRVQEAHGPAVRVGTEV